MLLLLFALVAYFFLLVGAVAFLFCVALKPLRRFALSVALWFAMWGPCSIAILTAAGVALVADAFIAKSGDLSHFQNPHLLSTFGQAYLAGGIALTVFIASAAARVHQFIVHRLTFVMFRLYATAVVTGVGSVFGWGLTWWLLALDVRHDWAYSLPIMLLLVVSFGVVAYRNARALRGKAPQKIMWISEEEFAG